MNAHVERFNRTLQEEFLDYHEDLLLEPDDLNKKMVGSPTVSLDTELGEDPVTVGGVHEN